MTCLGSLKEHMAKVSNIFTSVVYIVDQYAFDPIDQTLKLTKILRSKYANYEVIVVDNGLNVTQLSNIKNLLKAVSCIRVIRLSRSHDTDTAVFAGVEASIGDYICVLYNNDPVILVPEFINQSQKRDIIFGVATNLSRKNLSEKVGASLFYWYSNRFLGIKVAKNSTYFISMNRSAANALTRSGRFMRHIRHMAQRVGFTTSTFSYDLPAYAQPYTHAKTSTSVSRAIDLVSNYSSHPLRVLSYCGIVAGLFNIVYAVYVVIINLSSQDVAKGWTTLSLQSSLMFFLLFIILAVLAEYIGKILNESQQEPPYHIMQELSSIISIADETRLNVTK